MKFSFVQKKNTLTMQLALLAGIVCFTPGYGDQSSSGKDLQEPAYDADLFKKDVSIFFVNADFLYWAVNEGSLDYAIKMKHDPWSSSQKTFAVGHYKNASFDWSPGVRVSVGHFNAPHFWDVFAQYTYLKADGTDRAHAPHDHDEFLNGTWAHPDLDTGRPPAPLRRATSHIDLTYQVFELIFSRRFQTNEHFRLNFFGGLSSAIIFQKWRVNYQDINNAHSRILNRWRFEGLGLRLGTKFDWFLGWDFYLTGQASLAILAGWYKNSAFQKTSIELPDANNSRPIRDTHFHDTRLVPTGQFFAGPSWQKNFDCCRVELFAGYELTVWGNLHQIYRSGFALPTSAKETYINSSNLSLQGLRVHANVDF